MKVCTVPKLALILLFVVASLVTVVPLLSAEIKDEIRSIDLGDQISADRLDFLKA